MKSLGITRNRNVQHADGCSLHAYYQDEKEFSQSQIRISTLYEGYDIMAMNLIPCTRELIVKPGRDTSG